MPDENSTEASGIGRPASDCSPFLIVEARVRYWDDSSFNGVDDSEDGDLAPFKCGESWCPIICIATGRVQNWPQGTTASIHYKICDAGEYWLADTDGTKRFKWKGHYVPDDFLCMGDDGYGDYIILEIMEDSQIAEWTFPVIDFDEWESLENV